MTGPTSKPPEPPDPGARPEQHTAELVERHRITLPAGHGGHSAAQITEQCRRAAEDWAESQGVIIDVTPVAGSSTLPGSAFNGVTFELTLARGDIHADQQVPGVLDIWTRSARLDHYWAGLLTKGRMPRGRIITRPADGMASVTAINDDAHRSLFGTGVPPSLDKGTQLPPD